jgi:hypothetical protein
MTHVFYWYSEEELNPTFRPIAYKAICGDQPRSEQEGRSERTCTAPQAWSFTLRLSTDSVLLLFA